VQTTAVANGRRCLALGGAGGAPVGPSQPPLPPVPGCTRPSVPPLRPSRVAPRAAVGGERGSALGLKRTTAGTAGRGVWERDADRWRPRAWDLRAQARRRSGWGRKTEPWSSTGTASDGGGLDGGAGQTACPAPRGH